MEQRIDMEAVLPGILLVAAGLFSMAGGIFNWGWFMNSGRARLFVKLFSRTGARIFYVILGFVIAGAGVATLF